MFGPAGVREHGIGASRLPRNLGRPGLSAIHVRTGTRITNPRLAGYACWTGGSKAQAQSRYREANAKEATRDGGQGIGAPHTTDEVGELYQREPALGKEAPGCGPVGGPHGRCFETGNRVHETPTDSRIWDAPRVANP